MHWWQMRTFECFLMELWLRHVFCGFFCLFCLFVFPPCHVAFFLVPQMFSLAARNVGDLGLEIPGEDIRGKNGNLSILAYDLGQRTLVGYSLCASQKVGHNWLDYVLSFFH